MFCYYYFLYHVFQWHLSNCVLQLILNSFFCELLNVKVKIIFWSISHYHCDKIVNWVSWVFKILNWTSDEEACANMGAQCILKLCVTLLNEHGHRWPGCPLKNSHFCHGYCLERMHLLLSMSTCIGIKRLGFQSSLSYSWINCI